MFLAALVLAILAALKAPDEITVVAAASLSDALTEIGARYERETGTAVRLSFGGSSMIARQIAAGAPADVFVSADEAKVDELETIGAIETRVSLLSNSLAVVVPSDSTVDLLHASSIAIAEPESVPAGIYAKRYLVRAGLWASLQQRIIPTSNVRGALAAVEAGNADAAVVYRTDALISRRVRIAQLIPWPEISYPAAVLRGAPNPGAARSFLAYLQGASARAVFVRHGFIVR